MLCAQASPYILSLYVVLLILDIGELEFGLAMGKSFGVNMTTNSGRNSGRNLEAGSGWGAYMDPGMY